MTDERDARSSDVPADLSREREAFVRQFIRKGFELTEGMLQENRELREQIDGLSRENARLRAQVASDDAIRDLLRKIEQLEVERRSLLEKESVLREVEERSVAVEQELHDLANLYIASSHLHSALSVRGVSKHLGELLQQLLGADRWAVYVLEADGERARALVSVGDAPPEVRVGQGALGEAMLTRIERVAELPQPAGTFEAPIVALPLLVRDVCVGIIGIASVFEQKERWAAVDRELLQMLGEQAGLALLTATLFMSWRESATEPKNTARWALANVHEYAARGSESNKPFTRERGSDV